MRKTFFDILLFALQQIMIHINRLHWFIYNTHSSSKLVTFVELKEKKIYHDTNVSKLKIIILTNGGALHALQSSSPVLINHR